MPKTVVRWLTLSEIQVQADAHRLCDGDGRYPEEVRIMVTSYQRRAGEIWPYEHYYSAKHGQQAALWKNVPVEGTPRGLNERAGH